MVLLVDYNRVGVLAGQNYGTISNVSAGISVSASEGSSNYVGGLVGTNGDANSSSIIQNSLALALLLAVLVIMTMWVA